MPIGNSSPGPGGGGGALNGSFGSGAARFTLSESTYGQILAVGTSATLIHDGTKTPFAMEEIYLWAHNYSGANLTLQLSVVPPEGTAFGTNNVIHAPLLTKNGLYLVYPGVPSLNCKIYAKAAGADTINITGFVLKHYPRDVNNLAAGYNGTES